MPSFSRPKSSGVFFAPHRPGAHAPMTLHRLWFRYSLAWMPMSLPPPVPEQLSRTIETLYRSESGRVLATLVRLLGDLDLAEESMHEAFAAALTSWPQSGIPDNPRPWLISTARFKAIDAMRRRARFDGIQRDLVSHVESRVKLPAGITRLKMKRLRTIASV
ncbi:MAG TPA: sigma factor [Terracidiphilus sp.]|jgi:RNA polymerase sigma-70 factor (ECF subfamily)|nr:sigma factor [Terracidiphilus sp.]